MRLTGDQRTTILDAVHRVAGANARVILYGSRLDDGVRGGDVDLLVESDDGLPLLQRARLKSVLESSLTLPVDVVTVKRGASLTPFQRIALTTGVPL